MIPTRRCRLAANFALQKQCRENWKENALKKQEKMREYVQLTRSLKKSRERWKARAKAAEQEVKKLRKQLAEFSPSSSNTSPDDLGNNDEESERIPHHHYTITTISVVVQQFIKVGNSYRGVAKTMQLISDYSSLDTPHYSSIKAWMERLGLYTLQRPKEKRVDWLFIIDLTLELGKSKALVIYGIAETHWQTRSFLSGRGLKPTDGQILALEVTAEATGEWIHSVLESLSQQVGVPRQIIADRAPNLYKGIQLFQAQHQRVIYTYDVTHAMANLLKKELFKDEIFQSFLTDCHECRLQVQQTELAFAAPPAQRSQGNEPECIQAHKPLTVGQCRYFNLDRLVNWARKILKSDLALFSRLLPNLSLSQLVSRLKDKFAWLGAYRKAIRVWKHLLFMTRTLEKQLKTFGLNLGSIPYFSYRLSQRKIPDFLYPFQQQILTYLQEQVYSTPDHTLLATSDVLESIFGRYKYFSQRAPISELRSLLLTIPLTTINFTNEFVRNALTTVRSSDLSQWVQQVFGQSNLSKRKLLFGH